MNGVAESSLSMLTRRYSRNIVITLLETLSVVWALQLERQVAESWWCQCRQVPQHITLACADRYRTSVRRVSEPWQQIVERHLLWLNAPYVRCQSLGKFKRVVPPAASASSALCSLFCAQADESSQAPSDTGSKARVPSSSGSLIPK